MKPPRSLRSLPPEGAHLPWGGPAAGGLSDDRLPWAVRLALVLTALAASAALWWPAGAHAATRIKEVATVQGVRANQLVGYGLVVGLDGTGDQSQGAPFTAQITGCGRARISSGIWPSLAMTRCWNCALPNSSATQSGLPAPRIS